MTDESIHVAARETKRLPAWTIAVLVGVVATAMGGLSYLSDSGKGPPTEGTSEPKRQAVTSATSKSTVSLEQVRRFIRQRSVVFVDARSPKRYRAGHLPGAINVPATDGDADLPRMLRRQAQLMPVVVYCESKECPYADRVAARLRREGMHPVHVFKGGWVQWRQRDLTASVGP